MQKRLFREGSDVKAGQPLFTIDSAPYAAAAASARAGQARAEANLAQATALAERYKPLVEANAISKQEYANAVAAQKQAAADVAVGKANVQTASITLGYASVTAPISGRIGRSLVTEGALVGQGDATQLAVIQQINPMYVNFTQSASDVMKLRAAMASGQFKRASGPEAASVRIVLEDGSEYAQPGRLLFSDLTVDATTGQITLARRSAQPRRTAAARPVCARAAGAGPGQQRHHLAAAGGDAHRAGRHGDGGGQRRQGRAAHRSRSARPRARSGWCSTASRPANRSWSMASRSCR